MPVPYRTVGAGINPDNTFVENELSALRAPTGSSGSFLNDNFGINIDSFLFNLNWGNKKDF